MRECRAFAKKLQPVDLLHSLFSSPYFFYYIPIIALINSMNCSSLSPFNVFRVCMKCNTIFYFIIFSYKERCELIKSNKKVFLILAVCLEMNLWRNTLMYGGNPCGFFGSLCKMKILILKGLKNNFFK